MISPSSREAQNAVSNDWREEYVRHLDQRLERSLAYLAHASPAEIHTHLQSFLSLLDEGRRFPALIAKTLELIAALHPLPLRWGAGHRWEPALNFALAHTPTVDVARRAEYRCALADVYLFSGKFEQAIAQGEAVLAARDVPDALAARAARVVFLNLRATGRAVEASRRIAPLLERFGAGRPAGELPPERREAWLTINQCQLEDLRKRGEMQSALALAEEMVALNARTGSQNTITAAELLTHRSTLLWANAQYGEAAEDLKAAIAVYRSAEDSFNAESLLSNLGLVYWTMGELLLAETTLQTALNYYRKTGFEQLMVYDLGNLGLTYCARGYLDDAIRLTDEQIALAERLNFVTEIHRGQWNRGIMRFCQGFYADIKEIYDSSLTYYERGANRETYFAHFIWLAFYYQKMGDSEQALRLAREALRAGEERGFPLLEQISLRCLASIAPPEEREALLRRALALATGIGRKLEIAATWLSLAGACSPSEQRQEAWQRGADVLKEIGARQWLEGHSIEDPPFIPPFN